MSSLVKLPITLLSKESFISIEVSTPFIVELLEHKISTLDWTKIFNFGSVFLYNHS
ncbi:hypothetical protein KK423_06340 [Clostridioides difficile]|nr:hypothetical protein [Clostridioides difficile]